ncbi:MAG: D-alanyl-D-alanine carboxypeptidase [Alphaproteobacteria bacterium]|nr:MAG: D-alanyl-D-alanine carboxypeptidase [Alphaproteobacteria bacterium]
MPTGTIRPDRPSTGLPRMVALAVAAALLAGWFGEPARAAEALPSIVIDRESGAVLAHQRPFERWYAASLTKLMTVYVTLRAIAAGEVAPGSPVIVSRRAAGQPPSRMGLAPGTRLRLDNAIPVLVVKSANDIAVAVAESVAGSEAAFVERMNAEAARLGMTDSRFVNANGLHDPGQYVSARDMALLARQILVEFPEQAGLFAVPAIRFGDSIDHTYNLLLGRFAGADGMKTGFVCASGYNFVASASRGGRQLIAVVLGEFSQTDRALAGARLLLAGFERDTGPPIEQFLRTDPPVEAKSQRGRLCSESAVKQRYDPAAGQAVIDSPLLQTGLPIHAPISVTLGGIDAEPSGAWLAANLAPTGRLPVPARRPLDAAAPVADIVADTMADTVADPAAEPASADRSKPVLSAESIPVPTPRPTQ